jgi:Tfp pilus assembly protein PilV
LNDLGTLLDVIEGAPAWAPTLLLALAALVFRRHPAVPRRPRRLSSESGSMLIEVMIGALVLAITTTAVLNGLDGAQKTGGRNKARTVAAALAEQDQERMRSMPVSDLLPYVTTPYTRTVTVKGANYTVTSSASYAIDPGAVTTGCSASAKTQANLRILSSVTSPLSRGAVDLVGLVTPPAGTGFGANTGRLIVKVYDRDDDGTQGATVSLTGTASMSEQTNESGCAIFPFAPTGNYTAAITNSGQVGWDGETSLSRSLTSTAGQTTTYGPYYLDTGATINAMFDTKVGSAAAVNSNSEWITVNNPKLAVQRKTVEAASGLPSATVTASGLYPFLDGYGIYSGQCTTNNPGGTLPNTAPDPGQSLTTSPKIRMPSINIRVLNAAKTATVNGATVFVTTADGCATTYPSQVTATNTTTGGGIASLPSPGFPYGSYKICAQQTATGPHGHADIRTGTTPFYDSRQTTTVAAETSTNRVDDTVANTAAAGVPAFAANPIYPNTPVEPATTGSIVIRLNRTGACSVG